MRSIKRLGLSLAQYSFFSVGAAASAPRRMFRRPTSGSCPIWANRLRRWRPRVRGSKR